MTKAELLQHLAALPDNAQIYLMPTTKSTHAERGLLPIQISCYETTGHNNEHPAFAVISWDVVYYELLLVEEGMPDSPGWYIDPDKGNLIGPFHDQETAHAEAEKQGFILYVEG